MSPSLHMSNIFQPTHVTLGLSDHSHLPSIRAVVDYLNDLSKSSKPDQELYSHGSHHSQSASFRVPLFDVQETDEAFFLEGEFPGLRDKNAISIEKLGPRGLLIEAQVKQMELNEIWGDIAVAKDTPEDMKEASQVNTGSTEAGLERNGATGKQDQDEAGLKSKSRPNMLLHERRMGSSNRSFTFPTPIDFIGLRAKLRDGLLMIMVPKVNGHGKTEGLQVQIED